MSGPTLTPAARLARILVLPTVLGAVAIVVTAALGHPLIGLLITVGLALGAVNGVLAERAGSRLGPDDDRSVVVGGSMRRLGLITVIALVIAGAPRPNRRAGPLGPARYPPVSPAPPPRAPA